MGLWHMLTVHMKPHKVFWSWLCFRCGIHALLLEMNSVPHLWNTYTPHVTHPEGSIIPRSVSVACTLLSVSVFWLQGLSIYSFKSSGHLLDLWWWRLWPWDLSDPQRNKVSYRGKWGKKKNGLLSGSWQSVAMLWILSCCSLPDSIFKWLIFFCGFNLQCHLSFFLAPAFPEVASLFIVCPKLEPIYNIFFKKNQNKNTF